MHSPHPYLAAVGSYRRWYSVLVLLFFSAWIASLALPHGRPQEHASGLILLTFPQLLFYGWFLGLLAIVLVAHLKEMLGGATSRLIPGLVPAHFVIAGIVVAVFAVIIPLVAYRILGFRGAELTIVSLALAFFSLTALAVFRWSWMAFFVLYSPAMVVSLNQLERYLGRGLPWTPSAAATIVLLLVSAFCLAVLVFRLAEFYEEMPEYARRIPTSWRAIETWKGSTSGVGGWSFPIPMPRNLRALGRGRSVGGESLFERARHLHGVSRSIWGGATAGIAVIFMYGVYGLLFGWSGYNQLLTNPMNMMLSVLPVLMFNHPRYRGHLQIEFMRPYSRAQYIQAMGFLLATSCSIAWLLVNVAPVLVLWVATSENPLDNSTRHGPVHVRLSQQLPVSLCMMPLLFGIVSWPHKHVAALIGAVVGISVLSTIPLFVNDQLADTSAWSFRYLLASIFAAGLFQTWRSYRRWLDYDVVT